MNGKKAKELRRRIYGDFSLKTEREYFTEVNSKTLVAKGLRRRYQDEKRRQR